MFRLPRFMVVAAVAAIALLIAIPVVALAHESRDVAAGKYKFVVGWTGEPAYVGQRNGLDLTITNSATTQPVEGLEKTLKAEVINGSQKREVPLRAVFRMPGKYTADIVPTKEGDYRFHFTGMIEGVAIDETFDSANGKFGKVENYQSLQFPAAELSAAQLNETVAAAEAKATAAQSAAATSQIFGIAGLVFGILGLVVGGLALMNGRKAQAGAAIPNPRTTGR